MPGEGLHILQVGPIPPPTRSLSSFNADLIHALIKRGQKITILNTEPESNSKAALQDNGSYNLSVYRPGASISVYSLGRSFGFFRVASSFYRARRLQNEIRETSFSARELPAVRAQLSWLLKKNKPDLIHFLQPDEHAFVAAAMDLPVPTVFGHYFEDETAKPTDRRISERIFAGDAFLVAGSERIAKSLADKANKPEYVRIIPPFVKIPKPRTGRIRQIRNMLYIGEVSKAAHATVFLDAIAHAGETIPNLSLTVAGQVRSETEIRTSLDRLREKLQGRVSFASLPGQPMRSRWLQEFDLLLQPKGTNGISKIQLQVMAAGLPVVATTNGMGANGVIKDGETGFLVPEDDPQAMLNAIRVLCRDSQLAYVIGNSGRALVADKYSEERITRRLIDYFKQIIALKKEQ